VAYYNQDGTPVPGGVETRSNVAAGSHGNFPLDTTTLPTPFRGLAVIYSDGPVDAVARQWPSSFSQPGANSISRGYPVSADPGSTVTLPYVSNALDATYDTLTTIANTGSQTACVQITYSFVPGAGSVGADGLPPLSDPGPGGGGCATGYPVAVDGQLTFGPEGAGAGILPMPGGTTDALMSATVTSTGASVAASVYAYLTNGSLKGESYSGFSVKPAPATGPRTDDLGTEISIPVALKTADGYYSEILISNPNPNPATITIDYETGTQTYPVNLTIPANGVGNHSVYADNVVPIGFIGAAVVHSSQPVAAVVFRSKMTTAYSYVDEDLYTAMNGVPVADGSTTANFPYVTRRINADAAHAGYNSWESVSVVGGGTAHLTLTTVAQGISNPTCTTSTTFTTTMTITGSFVFYQNADQDNGLGANPSCLVGTMTITSDVPIIAVGDVVNDLINGDQEGGYNAFTS